MTILAPGTFNVSDHRKDIPDKVTREVLKRYRRDHRPPLCDRPYDTEAGDFIPPQLDPAHIDLIEIAEHDRRTFGRAPGAAKTVTTRGSDVGERKRTRKIRTSEAEHEAALRDKLLGPKPSFVDPRQEDRNAYMNARLSRWPKGRKLRGGNSFQRRP